mmetsp:Transcript_6175/g.11653  ORF Transcript_6175/g.11653 Transcript_6175/m.11653 type:complete len:640 (-) Transcript_6175:249-2168(-)
MNVRNHRELVVLLESKDIRKSSRRLDKFFKAARVNGAILNVFKEGFNDILDKLFGTSTQSGWLAEVTESKTIQSLFASSGHFFNVVLDLTGKNIKLPDMYRRQLGHRVAAISFPQYYFLRFMMHLKSRARSHSVPVNDLAFSPGFARVVQSLQIGKTEDVTYQYLLQDYLDYLFPCTISQTGRRRREDHCRAFLSVFIIVWLQSVELRTSVPFHPPNRLVLHSIERTLVQLALTDGMWNRLIQRELFHFFKRAFHEWPMEKRARLPELVSIWLVYIQPWKRGAFRAEYTRRKQVLNGFSITALPALLQMDKKAFFAPVCTSKTVLKDKKFYTDDWEKFVDDNLGFYTIIYFLFLMKAKNMKLTAGNLQVIAGVLGMYNVGLREVIKLYDRIILERDRSGFSSSNRHISRKQLFCSITQFQISKYQQYHLRSKNTRYAAQALYNTLAKVILGGRQLDFSTRCEKIIKRKFWDIRGYIAGNGLDARRGSEDTETLLVRCKKSLREQFGVNDDGGGVPAQIIAGGHGAGTKHIVDTNESKYSNVDIEVDAWEAPPSSYECRPLLIICYSVNRLADAGWARCFGSPFPLNLRFCAAWKNFIYLVLLAFVLFRYWRPLLSVALLPTELAVRLIGRIGAIFLGYY